MKQSDSELKEFVSRFLDEADEKDIDVAIVAHKDNERCLLSNMNLPATAADVSLALSEIINTADKPREILKALIELIELRINKNGEE